MESINLVAILFTHILLLLCSIYILSKKNGTKKSVATAKGDFPPSPHKSRTLAPFCLLWASCYPVDNPFSGKRFRSLSHFILVIKFTVELLKYRTVRLFYRLRLSLTYFYQILYEKYKWLMDLYLKRAPFKTTYFKNSTRPIHPVFQM